MAFRQGLHILEQVRDFATLRETINRMISIVSPEDLHYARDAVARIIRLKQTIEFQEVQGYPDAMIELDKKYRDLYLVLRYAKPRGIMQLTIGPDPSRIEPIKPEVKVSEETKSAEKPEKAPETKIPETVTTSETGVLDFSKQNQLMGLNQLSQLNPISSAILEWIKSHKGTIFKGTAVATSVGGAYWLYKYLTAESEKKLNNEDTTFDKTIKSIQKYKAFSHMMKNPDMENVEQFLTGKPIINKKKRTDKKDDKKPAEKDQEWETDGDRKSTRLNSSHRL